MDALVLEAQQNKRTAQAEIFERLGGKMFGVCRNYIKDWQQAEEVMLDGFFKALTKIDQLKHEGAFEGWLRQIMIRECLSWLRRSKELTADLNIETLYTLGIPAEVESVWTEQTLAQWIDELTPGCKVVFLLYEVEGYKHHEIADLLQISEGASKSQLSKARRALQTLYRESKQENYAT